MESMEHDTDRWFAEKASMFSKIRPTTVFQVPETSLHPRPSHAMYSVRSKLSTCPDFSISLLFRSVDSNVKSQGITNPFYRVENEKATCFRESPTSRGN